MHQYFKARPRLLMGLIACAALAACGGGDGQDDSTAQNEGETQANALETTTTSTWKWIANEWGKFTLSSQRTVRYGVTGKWVQKTLPAGTYSCTNSFFGKDPAYGAAKHCEVYTSTTTTTTTPTTATASLVWSASTQSGVIGYRLYYGTAAGNYQQAKGSGIAVGNATSYKLSSLKSRRVLPGFSCPARICTGLVRGGNARS